jgi:hypothetical protein
VRLPFGLLADLPRKQRRSISGIPQTAFDRYSVAVSKSGGASVTTKIAFILVGLILGFFLLDFFVLHLDAPLFLARKLLQLVEWLAFWR